MKHRNGFVSNSSSSSFMMIGISDMEVIEDYLKKHSPEYAEGVDMGDILYSISDEGINGLDLQIGYDTDELYLGLYPNEILTTMLLPDACKKVLEMIDDPRVSLEDVTLFCEVIEG